MAVLWVLQVMPAMNCGGMETFVMNVYRNIDRKQVQFDFLYHYPDDCFFDEEIRRLGGHIYKLSVRKDNNLPKYLRELDQFFARHPYAVIHGHYSGFGLFYNHYAKKHGVKARLGHSHSTGNEKGFAGFADRRLSSFFKNGLTHRLACGQAAGRALYGRLPFELTPNGIELERFAFDEAAGRAVRALYGLEDAVVYGHVGRFSPVKNHGFLLEVFAELAKRQPTARLLLVGQGALEGEVRQRAEALDLADRVVFAGLQANTPAYLSAMDAFVFPSRFEGLPMVLVEAQANGLACFVSDRVSPEAALAPGYHTLSLDKAAAQWATEILDTPLERRDNTETLRQAGYDIKQVAARLQALYLELAAENLGVPPES